MKYAVQVKFRKDFVEVKGNTIVVGVVARPEKGKANEELIKKIAGHFGVSQNRVALISGARSKRKIVEIL